MNPDVLDLVPRDALIDAIARRYPTMVICLHAPRGDGTSNRMVWFHGDPMIGLGLATMAAHEMVGRIQATEEVDPEQTQGESE
jgi:hypothetical protein